MRWLKDLLAIMTGIIVAMVAASAHAEQWQTIYQTDFSTDPGWTTNVSSQMYWDSSSGRYHVESRTGGDQYTYFNVPFSESSSFKLEFDLTMVNLDDAAAISFGLSNADKVPLDYWNSPSLWVNYGKGDGGKAATANYASDTATNSFPGPYVFSISLDTIYHNVITYGRDTEWLG